MADITHLVDMAGPQARELRESGRWLVEHRREMEQGESGWLDQLARFDDDAGWVAYGQRSCVDWLRWKTKMARSTCYEKLQVAHALQQHEAVGEAYRAGRISYSAARLICRLESLEPATESSLVDLAEKGTVRQLEQACEAYRQLAGQERPPPDPHLHRGVRLRPDLDGWVRVEITMPRLEADELVTVLDAFMAVDRRARRDGGGNAATTARAGDQGGPPERTAEQEKQASARTDDGEATAGGPGTDGEGAPAHPEQGQEGPASARADDGEPAAAPGGDGGRTSAGEEGGPVFAQADDDHPGDSSGEPAGAAGTGQPEETARWHATRALAFTEMVRCALAHVDGGRAAGDDRYLVHVVARDGQLTLVDGTPIDPATAEEICCDASIVAHTVDEHGEPLRQGRRTREWSTAQRRAVLVRDGGRCRFVGCERRVRDIHHCHWWEAGGSTDVDNAMACCRAHHSLLHHGFAVTTHTDGALSFTAPDGAHLGTTYPAQRRLAMAA